MLRHQLRILAYMMVAVTAASCLKLNPDYQEETDGGTEACGPDGGPCADTHYCEEDSCVRKKSNGEECQDADACASHYCDTICCEPNGPCCVDQSECGGQTPVCSSEFRCVECGEHADCQITAGDIAPLDSPLGLCTPDHLCTCWVENEKDPCDSSLQCPADNNFVCAQDGSTGDHFSCLRRCTEESLSLGMACVNRTTAEYGAVTVWAPVTSCYAFNTFDAPCTGDGNCSVFDAPPYEDGTCHDQRCTYSCLNTVTEEPDDNWCPVGYTCGNAPDSICLQ